MNIEIFSCAGGMAKGFKDAGITFDFAFDFAPDHCESYRRNIGHKPICMDVRDLLRLARAGLFGSLDHAMRPSIKLLVADPPCTPWSRSGLRLGTSDERDMLEDTCELIRILRPATYLIGNVPGLDDSKNWGIVQRVIGGLSKYGYCTADFAALDAANYGVPQHRVRPFWFGHLHGPCIQWPAPTHCDPRELRNLTLPGITELQRWRTCRDALGHLSPDELGRPVKLRKRACNGKQHGSVRDRPARVVGTSNLSDGNVLLTYDQHHPPSDMDEPGNVVRAGSGGGATRTIRTSRQRAPYDGGYTPSELDAPAKAIVRNTHGNGTVLKYDAQHPPSDIDEPAMTIRASDGEGAKRAMRLRVKDEVIVGKTAKRGRKRDEGRPGQGMRVGNAERPSKTVTAKASRVGAGAAHVLEWPWDRPSTTLCADDRVAPPGHHDENWDGGTRSVEGAVVISEKAATLLQGFPEDWHFEGKTKKIRWSQIGQAMPPPLAHAVATSVAAQHRATDEAISGVREAPPPSLATGKLTVV